MHLPPHLGWAQLYHSGLHRAGRGRAGGVDALAGSRAETCFGAIDGTRVRALFAGVAASGGMTLRRGLVDMEAAVASQRIALRVLQLGAFAVVVVSAPYKMFDLDRFFVPKELVLNAVVLVVVLLCLVRVRRIALARVDQLLALWLVLGVLSAVFATNWWLAGRAVAISLSGAACFWCARLFARVGLSRPLVAALALAGVIGATTALLQAYGIHSELRLRARLRTSALSLVRRR